MPHLEEKLTIENLKQLSERFGNAFYILDSEQFSANYKELKNEFQKRYPNFNIAYSYKTNYIPKLCMIVDEMDGYAEVVSDMEMEIARRCGVSASHIIWNGPVKNRNKIEELLISGGTVNIDNISEAKQIEEIASEYKNHLLNVGLRCNFDVKDGVQSRFGFDVDGRTFGEVCRMICNTHNLHLRGIQCHFAKRKVEFWPERAKGMLKIYDELRKRYDLTVDWIDIGGGLYGKMPEELMLQLGCESSGYEAYAEASAELFFEKFKSNGPELFIEPGSALVGDCMKFVARVENIREIRGKSIAVVLGSQKNISMTGINPPMDVIDGGGARKRYSDIDIAGYTCIESDVLFRHYNGEMGVEDFLVFSNCGSYSVVMKPPFIMPNFPILDISNGVKNVEVIKRAETFDDLFGTYSFDHI